MWRERAPGVPQTGFARSTQRYLAVADPQLAPRLRLRELAAAHVRWGHRPLWLLLRREGYPVNHKRSDATGAAVAETLLCAAATHRSRVLLERASEPLRACGGVAAALR